MPDQPVTAETYNRTRSTSRQARGGSGCCGCCAGAAVFGAFAVMLGLWQVVNVSRALFAGLDSDQRLGLSILVLLALAAFLFTLWRWRPTLKRTTTVVTRVSRAATSARREADDAAVLDAEWRPADSPVEDDPTSRDKPVGPPEA